MYLAPRSLAEALQQWQAHPDAVIVGGGTRVMALPLGERPEKLMDLAHAGLDVVQVGDASLAIGATASLAALVDLPQPFGALADAARSFRPDVVRRQASVGGNVAVGGSLVGALALLDAVLVLASATGSRRENTDAPFVQNHEIAEKVLIGAQPIGQVSGRLAIRRTALGPAVCAVNLALWLQDGVVWARAVVQSAAPALVRLSARPLVTPQALAAAVVAAVTGPQHDKRASGDYRRAMAGVLTERLALQLRQTLLPDAAS